MVNKKTEGIDAALEGVQKSINTLIIVELIKSGATRAEVREVLGSLNNLEYAKINKAIKNRGNVEEGDHGQRN